MKIKEITVAVGKTINMGNYESERIDVSATALVTGTDPDDTFDELLEYVDAKVKETVAKLKL